MQGTFTIKLIPHRKIDKAKWDRRIETAGNGLVYAYSFYLDHMSRHWDALVLDDYKAVMPLTWNRKFGISYLYQPAFTASLGVFGIDVSRELTTAFLEAIPKKFSLVEISLNTENLSGDDSFTYSPRVNFVLPLDRTYDDLRTGYRENHRRNIQKSMQAGLVLKKNIGVGKIIELNRRQMLGKLKTSARDYEQFEKLYTRLQKDGKAMSYGVFNAEDKLLSSCVFFFSHSRAYYILAGNDPESRNSGASHALIDAFIRDHAGTGLLLDFEGSDIETLALFYSGFGARKEIYPAIYRNRLPWFVNWLK